MSKALLTSFLIGICAVAAAQADLSGFRNFQSKEGKAIEGRILSVSKDWIKMKIVNRTSTEFEFEVNKLILDDQQFVKNWIKSQPAKADFEVEVNFTKSSSSPDRERTSYYLYETREVGFEIALKNKSTETLAKPKIEYVLIYDDKLRIYQSSIDNDWTYSTSSVKGLTGIYGESTINDLEYNREQIVKTNAIKYHKAMGDGNVLVGEDEIIGVLVRITTQQGLQVGMYPSNDSKAGRYSWDQAFKLAQGATPDPDGFDMPMNRQSAEFSANIDPGDDIEFQSRAIEIAATVTPSGKGEGVIAAVGGGREGLSLYVKDRKIHFVQTIRGEEKVVSADLPLGEFTVNAHLEKEKLRLLINGRDAVEAESFGYFSRDTSKGFEIGEDRGTDRDEIAGSYGTPFPFSGAVRSAVLRLAADDPPANP